ncbi:GDSL esterase/lipase 1-like [Herrania umbratica]|uniref:GDSL esterase/lipase 1-like n=1 Tax=Herrania umbratica TaxID=108875 RepID=A0A6J1AW84_9ROSI|nr:GDSL esterase/lipase 1-like [Herrania umbratica]
MASLRIHICFLLYFAIFLSLSSCYSLPENHVALFIFGDSLFDAGNNNYINTTVNYQANFWPYGETFFKYPTGRFSDGRLLPDFIAEYAGLPLIPPYLQPGNNNFVDGVNFASAGAGALVETYQGFVINLNTQVSYFKDVEKLLRQELGDAEAKRLLGRALYIISIGSNDYGVRITQNSSVLQSYSKEEYVAMVIGNLTVAIKEIHMKGGRKFGFLGLGPLGCTPGMKVLVSGSTGSCVDKATTLAHLHNKALSIALQKLENRLEGFKFANHDLYTSVSERMNNPSKYGFKVGNMACCGSGPYRGQSSCGGKRQIKEYQLCEKASEYLFFDSGHPTERANRQIAELIWRGTPNMTRPYNLKALFNL